MGYDPEIHHRKSIRLAGYDYSQEGMYFVTICTHQKVCLLADIEDGKIKLTAIGEIVADEWLKTPQIRQHVSLDEWIVMPNHLHGIVVINSSVGLHSVRPNNILRKDAFDASLEKPANNLSHIIRGFKSAVSRRVHAMGHLYFTWQGRFYDHIIRNDESLNKIRDYISNNPIQWEQDDYYPR